MAHFNKNKKERFKPLLAKLLTSQAQATGPAQYSTICPQSRWESCLSFISNTIYEGITSLQYWSLEMEMLNFHFKTL